MIGLQLVTFGRFAVKSNVMYTKRYCDQNFKLIGIGSSRYVYDMGDKCLKLAIGEKGKDQNMVEVDCAHFYALPAQIFDYSEDYSYIICEKAERKATAKDFKDNGFTLAELRYFCRQLQDYFHSHKNIKFDYEEGSIFNELFDMVGCIDIMPMDWSRKSSWGIINGELRLLDCGLSKTVFKKHYQVKK